MSNRGNSFKKQLISISAIAILGGGILGLWQFLEFNDGKLHLVFCDVGQGDGIYLKSPNGQEVLIDGGPDDKILDCLSSHRPFFDRKIEVLILTHPEADHLTGLIAVLQRYKVDSLIIENIGNDTEVYSKFRQAVIGEGMKIYNPKKGDRLRLGEAEINFYWPQSVVGQKNLWSETFDLRQSKDKISNLNDYSLVLALDYKNFSAFLSGDAESSILEKISNLDKQVAVLKVPHHGSKNALSNYLLGLLKPKLAVISVGKENRFGHPSPETLGLLKDFGIKTLRTDQEGEIEIVSDGRGWSIQ